MDNPVTLLSVIISITGLLGYLIRLIVPRLLEKIDAKDDKINELTQKFTDTVNHKQTEMTDALKDLTETNKLHMSAVEAQTKVFEKLLK